MKIREFIFLIFTSIFIAISVILINHNIIENNYFWLGTGMIYGAYATIIIILYHMDNY